MFMKNLLFTDKEEKMTLSAAHLYLDKPGFGNSVNRDESVNYNEYMRSTLAAKDKIQMSGRLCCDIFESKERYLSDKCSASITLIPHKTDYCMIQDRGSNLELKATITNAFLTVGRTRLPRTKNTFNYKKYTLYNFIHPAKTKTFEQIVTSGKIPDFMIVFISSEAAQNGGKETNRLVFDHNNVEQVTMSKLSAIPSTTVMNLDFERDLYAAGYLSLFKDLKAKLDLDYESYDSGYTIYGFTPNKSTSNEIGETKISIRFRTDPPANLVISVLCIGEKTLRLNTHGAVVAQ